MAVSVADLDAIAARVEHGPGFDVSPRGVSFRPDPEIEQLLAVLGPDDVPALTERLKGASDPLLALTWMRALVAVRSPEAEQALNEYVDGLNRHDPWPGAFPGRRELLLYLGRN
jgi:hypothetical protein